MRAQRVLGGRRHPLPRRSGHRRGANPPSRAGSRLLCRTGRTPRRATCRRERTGAAAGLCPVARGPREVSRGFQNGERRPRWTKRLGVVCGDVSGRARDDCRGRPRAAPPRTQQHDSRASFPRSGVELRKLESGTVGVSESRQTFANTVRRSTGSRSRSPTIIWAIATKPTAHTTKQSCMREVEEEEQVAMDSFEELQELSRKLPVVGTRVISCRCESTNLERSSMPKAQACRPDRLHCRDYESIGPSHHRPRHLDRGDSVGARAAELRGWWRSLRSGAIDPADLNCVRVR